MFKYSRQSRSDGIWLTFIVIDSEFSIAERKILSVIFVIKLFKAKIIIW